MSQEQQRTESDEILTGAAQYEAGVYAPAKTEQAAKPPDEFSSFEAFHAKYNALMQGLPDKQQREMYRNALLKKQAKEASDRIKDSMKRPR